MTTDEGCFSIIDARTFYNVSPQCGPNGQSAPNPAEMEPWSELSTVEESHVHSLRQTAM